VRGGGLAVDLEPGGAEPEGGAVDGVASIIAL
jgi:hypothetical protein